MKERDNNNFFVTGIERKIFVIRNNILGQDMSIQSKDKKKYDLLTESNKTTNNFTIECNKEL